MTRYAETHLEGTSLELLSGRILSFKPIFAVKLLHGEFMASSKDGRLSEAARDKRQASYEPSWWLCIWWNSDPLLRLGQQKPHEAIESHFFLVVSTKVYHLCMILQAIGQAWLCDSCSSQDEREGTRVTQQFELPYGCWGLNQSPLKVQPELLTSESYFYPLNFYSIQEKTSDWSYTRTYYILL